MTHLRDFFRVAPSNNDHHPAIRCAIGVGIPLLTLLAIGRTDLSLFAVIGAFTGVYGRGLAHGPRFSQQWRAGLLLLAALAAGLLVAHRGQTLETIAGLTGIVAALGFLATRFARLRPDGSLFYVFGFSAVAFMPTPAPFAEAMTVAALTVLLSLIVGVATRVLPSHRSPWVRDERVPLSSEERLEAYVQTGMHAAAVALAGLVAINAGFGHAYWAMMAATAALVGATTGHRIARGLHRILGAFAGLVLASVLLSLQLRAWQTILVVLVLQILLELYVTRHYALAQMFVTPLSLLMNEMAVPAKPWTLLADRGVSTVIGAGIGMALGLLLHAVNALGDEPG